MLLPRYLLLLLLTTGFFLPLSAQKKNIPLSEIRFKKGGDVVKMRDGCFRLTQDRPWSSGALWYPNPINLAEDFEMELDVFLGCREVGADGIVFIFSPTLSLGYAGEGMGFAGLYPSLGIEMDTYQNLHLGDPQADHVAVLSNGLTSHRFDLAGPVKIATNLEDCKNHRLEVTWIAGRKELRLVLDGKNLIGLQKNIVADIFNDNPNVYWGISAATGAKYNTHKVCFEKLVFEEIPVDLEFSFSEKYRLFEGETLVLDKVDFQPGKSTLKKDSYRELNKLVNLLKDNPEYHLGVFGHTDNTGNEQGNEIISGKRAQEVIDFLVAHGISKDRLSANGLGERFPIASNNNASGRFKNRRVEIHIYRPIP